MEEPFFLEKSYHQEDDKLFIFFDVKSNELTIYDTFRPFLMLLCILFGGSCAAIIIFAIMADNMRAEEMVFGIDSESESDSEEEEEYEKKYLDHYDELEDKDLDDKFLETLKDRFVEDETPEGIIKMNYDKDLDAFTYYTDKKNIPYDYLETVARLFIVLNNCKKIYVNYKLEIEKAQEEEDIRKKEKEEKEKEAKEKNAEEKETEKKSVFASFKTYKVDKKNNKNNKNFILPESSNRYIYKGKILDYEKTVQKNEAVDEFEDIDYNTFKKNN